MTLAAPFDTPPGALLDVARLLVSASGFAVALLQIRLWAAHHTTPARARLLGVALALVLVAGSRLTNLGGDFAWQLPVGAVVVALLGYSTFPPRGVTNDPARTR